MYHQWESKQVTQHAVLYATHVRSYSWGDNTAFDDSVTPVAFNTLLMDKYKDSRNTVVHDISSGFISLFISFETVSAWKSLPKEGLRIYSLSWNIDPGSTSLDWHILKCGCVFRHCSYWKSVIVEITYVFKMPLFLLLMSSGCGWRMRTQWGEETDKQTASVCWFAVSDTSMSFRSVAERMCGLTCCQAFQIQYN